MTQSLKRTPLSTGSGLPQVVGLSFGDPGPDISLLKAFLGGLGTLVGPFLLWHPPLLLGQGLRKLPATTCDFLPNCLPFPPQLLTFADHSCSEGTEFKEKKERPHWSFPYFMHYQMQTTSTPLP